MKRFHKILLIDDDPASNFMHRLVLTDMHIAGEIVVLEDGQKALGYVAEHCTDHFAPSRECPNLILLDINMPILTGHEFLEGLANLKREHRTEEVVVVITTSTHHRDVTQMEEFGVKAYLEKPLTEEKLQEVLERFSLS